MLGISKEDKSGRVLGKVIGESVFDCKGVTDSGVGNGVIDSGVDDVIDSVVVLAVVVRFVRKRICLWK